MSSSTGTWRKIHPPLYLYTHWGGYELPEVLAAAIGKRWRWDDGAYLTRIIFCEMVQGHEKEETGFGISTYAPDNEYPWLVVDVARQVVRIVPYDWRASGPPRFDQGEEIPFAEVTAEAINKHYRD